MKVFLILITLIATALFFTNPSDEDFKLYSKNYIASRVKGTEKNASKLKNMLDDLATEVGTSLTQELTESKNYYIFTLFEVKLDEQETYKFLGIGKNFLPLQTQEPFK